MSTRKTPPIASQQPRSYADVEADYLAEYEGRSTTGGEPGNTGKSKSQLVAAAVKTAKNYKPSDHLKDGSDF